MIFTDISIFERIGKRNANIASAITLGLLLLVFLFKLPFTPEIPKDEELGGGGVTVALGWPDAGSNDDTPSAGGGEPVPPVESKVTPVSPAPSPPSTNSGVITSEDKEVNYAAEAKKREDNKRKLQEIEEATKKRREEAAAATDAKRRADEAEAQRKAEADAYNKKKSGFGDLLKKQGVEGGSGKGSGNSGKAGNGGDPKGDPNSSNLEGDGGSGGGSGGGKGTGIGTSIGGGIGSRGVVGRSSPNNNYNENGDVVVQVCVMANGSVDASSVKVINKGTTTTSIILRRIATENARTYRFREGDDNQCGTITYRFKVK
ncbi:MAG: cell envelope integrity protein TolA [Saprospiraceae bacterium]